MSRARNPIETMEKFNVSKYLRISFAGLAMLALGACSGPDRPPEEVVGERAQARWDAVVAREFESAWAYYTPGFRDKSDAATFRVEMNQRPIRWDSAEVTEVDCSQEDKCEVAARIGYTAVGAPGQLAGMQNERTIRETWLRIGGDWWYTPAG